MNTSSDNKLDSARSFIIEAFKIRFAVDSLDKITVHDIVKKAGVSRSTFYLHFEDKYDLLHQVTQQIVHELSTFYNAKLSKEEVLKRDSRDWLLQHNTAICEHVDAYRTFYLRRLDDITFVSFLSDLLEKWMQAGLDEVRSTFAAYGTIGLIRNWLNNEPLQSIAAMAVRLTDIASYLLPDIAWRSIETQDGTDNRS